MGMYQALNTASDGLAGQLNTIAMNQQQCLKKIFRKVKDFFFAKHFAVGTCAA